MNSVGSYVAYYVFMIGMPCSIVAMKRQDVDQQLQQPTKLLLSTMQYNVIGADDPIEVLKNTPTDEIVNCILKMNPLNQEKVFNRLCGNYYTLLQYVLRLSGFLTQIGNIAEEEARDHARQFTTFARRLHGNYKESIIQDDVLEHPLIHTMHRIQGVVEGPWARGHTSNLFTKQPNGMSIPQMQYKNVVHSVDVGDTSMVLRNGKVHLFSCIPSHGELTFLWRQSIKKITKNGMVDSVKSTPAEFTVKLYECNSYSSRYCYCPEFRSYNLVEIEKSSSLEEALAHHIAFEIKKLNIQIANIAKHRFCGIDSALNARITRNCTMLSFNDNCFSNKLLERTVQSSNVRTAEEKCRLAKLPKNTRKIISAVEDLVSKES